MELLERLAHFIQRYLASMGRHLSNLEAEACASLVFLKYASTKPCKDSLEHVVSTIEPSQYKLHSMTLRSHTGT